MKAVKLATVLMFVFLVTTGLSMAQEGEGFATSETENTETLSDSSSQESENLSAEVLPYQGDIGADTIAAEIMGNTDKVINEIENNDSGTSDSAQAPSETPVSDEAQVKEEVKDMPSDAIVEAVKKEISERRKASGKLDIFDADSNKVRTLDLIEFKSGVKEDGDVEVVQANFRDTTSGDIVTLDIKVKKENDTYSVNEMLISSVAAPTATEVKKDYTDEELRSFMKDYIDTQSQATGTFDLYDEKAKKMRNLEFVSLDEKLRRYGIIAIATADFKDKNSGDLVKVDMNAENKNGLSITAMRLKGVTKAPPQQ